jgi:hypothetical protein
MAALPRMTGRIQFERSPVIKRILVPLIVLGALLSLTSSAQAAHLGNNKAELTGTGDLDATGQALLNYSDGTGLFNGSTSVANLTPGSTYTYLVRRANGTEAVICSGTANSKGKFQCSESRVNIPAPGFTTAVIRDMAGLEVASGLFDRRGNCREPDQAGSQCTAPGQS